MAGRMEEAEFDSIWVYDHFFLRWPERPTVATWECWTTLSALAQATTRVQLGSMVLGVPFRNPAVVAKMASTLDEVSGGRLILGLGAGWHEPEFSATGAPFDHRAGRFEEALKIICPLLRDGRVDFEGAFYSARESELAPRGPRAKGPPIMLAGAGPRMLLSEINPDKQKQLYNDVNDYILDQSFTVAFATNPYTFLMRGNVKEVDYLMHNGGLNLQQAWLA